MKSVNIISSLMGAGLHREALLLQELLASHGHTSRLMHYTDGDNAPMERADINISLEVVMPRALSLARENWLAPNSEWWTPQYDQYLSYFSKILCKTRDCFDIWAAKVGESRCVYTGFEARDMYRADIPRQNRFLHVAGKSGNKGTNAVLQAWQQIPNGLPPLTVIASNPEFKLQWEKNHSNINFYSKVEELHLVELMNSHQFHIQPSPYEGFGHVQHEGLSCGAFVIVTAAPPFLAKDHAVNGTATGFFPIILPSYTQKQRLATMSIVSPESVRQACYRMLTFAGAMNSGGRTIFLQQREFFRATFMQLVESV